LYNRRSGGTGLVNEMGYTVVFWNLENFFDTKFDEGREDGHFTPNGEMRWSRSRFIKKRNGIAKTIIDIGVKHQKNIDARGFPALIGFAEIENRYVLNQLIYETPLAMGSYSIVHRDSPDRRGIDVALLFCKRQFRPLKNSFIRVTTGGFKEDEVVTEVNTYVTREILYCKGVLHDLDTLHVFVNHWPSKYGGEKQSAPYREAAADALARVCDSILMKNSKANIIVMGDFNDTPDSRLIRDFEQRSTLKVMSSYHKRRSIFSKELKLIKNRGTIKYKGEWEMIDMFFVSDNLQDKNEPISTDNDHFTIFCANYLMERDRSYTGNKPKRTYIGPRYNGGLSDHLPIILRINRNW
jgi:endonuclease/exonuclease/phosphatase family metal-dependent hydrolase